MAAINRVEFYKTINGQWGWRFVAANNRIIADGFGFNTKRKAKQSFNRLWTILAGGGFAIKDK